ncbi:outer membrane protein [Bosea sp. NBC_00550]|uniref:outer membrane protein n=1 Tax=Bosea sp. NBC_00550 TaxID=2969621 RepID=UPI00222F9622|nr:outer membrane protein [Bosea sp. NBC_00550]UZF93927.1 porin family protein [Bosea sp. NBC_00550]
MFRSLFAFAMVGGLLPLTASAADLRSRYQNPPAEYYEQPAYRWQGFYLGAHGGLAFGKSFSFSSDRNGFVGGLQGGYNMQFGPAVAGVEVEGSYMGGSERLIDGARVEQNWRIAGKGRLGLSFDRTLLYATAGYAMTEFEAPSGSGVSDGWKGGYLVGAGLEQAFAGGLSAKAEYNYVSSNGVKAILPFGRSEGSNGGHVLKAGLNYRF